MADVPNLPHCNVSRSNRGSPHEAGSNLDRPVQPSSATPVSLGALGPGNPLRAYIPQGATLVEHRAEGFLEVYDPAYVEILKQHGVTDAESANKAHPDDEARPSGRRSGSIPPSSSPSPSSPSRQSVSSSFPSSSNAPASGRASGTSSPRAAPPPPTVKYRRFDARQTKAAAEGGEGGIYYDARVRDVIIMGEVRSSIFVP